MEEAQKKAVHGPGTSEKAKSYEEYLQLDKVLGGIRRLSEVNGDPAHDEHLFIMIHQAFEIWFKQLLFDMYSIMEIFDELCKTPERVLKEEEKPMLTVVQRLNRAVLVWKLLIDQFFIIETMSPLDFLEFRKHLGSASGFQSVQFRVIENKFGIKKESRKKYGRENYINHIVSEKSKKEIEQSEEGPTLFSGVEKWLESIHGIDTDFWDRYRKAAAIHLKAVCEDVLDEKKYKGRLSHNAFKGALRISLMREEPGYALPYQIMTLLTDVDGLIMKWRYNHVLMVHRMIGRKAGTGGSSGYEYLKSTVDDGYRVFIDFFNLSTFLIPRRDL